MTTKEFSEAVVALGGVLPALEGGLHAADLEDKSTKLYEEWSSLEESWGEAFEVWKKLEGMWSVIYPRAAEVTELLEK